MQLIRIFTAAVFLLCSSLFAQSILSTQSTAQMTSPFSLYGNSPTMQQETNDGASTNQQTLSGLPTLFNTNENMSESNDKLHNITSGAPNIVGQEDKYIVGPGDLFMASVWTTTENNITFKIESNGKAIIPMIGVIDLTDLTFNNAVKKIKKEISKKFINAKIDIVLIEAKTVSVPIYGAVVKPGVYTVSGTDRISDVILLSGGFLPTANARAIVIENPTLPVEKVDIIKDIRTQQNGSPYVHSGDEIYVPNRKDIIQINGAVNYPGIYDYVSGESLDDIIDIAGGLTRGVDSSRILVTRFLNDKDSIVRFEIGYKLAKTFVLQEDDYIFIPKIKDYRETRQVTITGEVMYPGKYAVREDKTHLIDIIGLAGGLTDKAYLPGSRIIRENFTDAGEKEYNRLLTVNPSDMSPDEKSYLKYRKANNVGQISISFKDLIEHNKDINNIILRGGDEIYIAKQGLSVNVMGAVINPGLVKYKEGEDVNYYIKQAGGYQDGALKKDVKVIRGGTSTWLKPKHVDVIGIGDAIWVPEKPYKDKVKQTRDILAILASISALVLTTITVMNYIDEN